MGERENLLRQLSYKLIAEIWEDRLNEIKKDYELYGQMYEEEFIDILSKLLCSASEENIKYIVISPLNSSVITKTYEMQITLLDERTYEEDNPYCIYWRPEFMYKDVDKDMDTFKRIASKEVVRLRDDEVNEIRRRYVLCHAYTFMFFIQKALEKMEDRTVWKEKEMSSLKIMYGTYMEQMIEINIDGRQREQL